MLFASQDFNKLQPSIPLLSSLMSLLSHLIDASNIVPAGVDFVEQTVLTALTIMVSKITVSLQGGEDLLTLPGCCGDAASSRRSRSHRQAHSRYDHGSDDVLMIQALQTRALHNKRSCLSQALLGLSRSRCCTISCQFSPSWVPATFKEMTLTRSRSLRM